MTIGRLFGIPVQLHWTLLVAAVLTALLSKDPTEGISRGVIVLSLVFLHELGHCYAAGRFGYHTKAIILSPIGGVAQIEGIQFLTPAREATVAVAGPAVNVVLAMAALPFNGPVADFWTALNLGLVMFNLIPAFPMDGGRVLRAALAARMRFDAATLAAVKVSYWACGGMVLIGLFTLHFGMVAIGVLIALSAKQEAATVKMDYTGRAVRWKPATIVTPRDDDPNAF